MRRENIPCRGCEKTSKQNEDAYIEERHDFHGISTGYWCEECYESDKYPYRKDNYYDYLNAGERLEDDY